ncbi:MAG: Gfo/Idh/MocA family oxidoreductase, partial [Lachnospiraceae bacterium]|nr:Gfo/Idh/MocA family oxidoreductase [Lachnospiraceae bacterium]
MKKRFAVIGYGGQGAWHTRQILASDVAELKGVYDIDPIRNRIAEENLIRVYESVDAVLSDPDVDAVVIATPNDVHKDLVIRSLQSGKNVISEKPAEMTVHNFDEMAAEAKRSGKLFSVHQNRRWDV